MKGEFLLDSSALYPLLNYVDKVDVSKIYILSLTFYEVMLYGRNFIFTRGLKILLLSLYYFKSSYISSKF